MKSYMNKLTNFREFYINEIQKRIPKAYLNGARDKRLPGNANISFEDIDGTELLFRLDEKGICASSGSACSTGSSNPSHVLTAIGLPANLERGALRVTFGDFNTHEEVVYLINSLEETINKMRNA